MYTQAYRPELLERVGAPDRPLTAEEHAYLTEAEAGRKFSSREALIGWYEAENAYKAPAVAFVVDEAKRRGVRSLVSLGAGPAVLELRLAQALPDCRVAAADYDGFCVARGRALFPELVMARFDFAVEDLNGLWRAIGGAPELALFFGSSYVLDDAGFAAVFRGLAEAGVRTIIDFYPSVLGWKDALRAPLEALKRNAAVRRLFGKGPLGKFHGYARDRAALRRLYRRAGLRIAREASLARYDYAAVLEK